MIGTLCYKTVTQVMPNAVRMGDTSTRPRLLRARGSRPMRVVFRHDLCILVTRENNGNAWCISGAA